MIYSGQEVDANNILGNVTGYTYDVLNRVTEEKAPNGAVTKYEYDVTGNLIAMVDAMGNKTTYEYDGNGNLTAVIDAMGQTASIQYDKNGQAVSAKQKNGGKLSISYDKAGRISEETDANGNKTRYAYNGRGLTTIITDAINQKAECEYDALGNLVRITAPGGQVILYEYDTAGRLMKTTDALGCETEYQYDVSGQIVQTIINGNTSIYEYDGAGNISAVSDAEDRRVQFEYDVAGNNTAVIYPDGSKDTIEYDLLGRVIRQIPRTGLMMEYAYDALGNVTSVKQGNQVTMYEYDLLGRLTKTIAADGSENTFEYDALGNLIITTDALGNSTRFDYTPESLLAKVTYANGTNQSLTYDLAGNVLSETDTEGYTKKYGYDKVNRLISVTDELGHKTAYAYDANDQIAQVKDALGRITGYSYDALGNLTAETDALGNTVNYLYTPEGWLEKVTKADGTEISYEYDKTGNLLKQQIEDAYTITTGYNELGQVTTLSNEAGEILYQYNDKGYLVAVTNVNGESVTYDYDEYGNKRKMIYPDGREVDYIYDALNRLTGVKDTDGEETRYEYDAAGRRIRTTTGTLTTAYNYDEVGNLISQSTEGDSSLSFSYSHNKNGYITGEIQTENGERTESSYQYDAAGQLISFRKSTGYAEQYAYDAAGNMTKKIISPEKGVTGKTQLVTIGMKYNKGNQLTEMTVGKEKLAYSYDPNGSLLQKVLNSQKYGTLTDAYTYDALDQLTSYIGYDGYEQAFAYDAAGMRLSKKEKGNPNRSSLEELLRGNISGLPENYEPTEIQEGYEWATTEYLYDITQEYYQVIREKTTTQNSTAKTEYVYGLERIAGYSDNNKTNFIYDGRGSVAQTITVPVPGKAAMDVLQEAQTAVAIQSYDYTPFGEQLKTKTNGFTYNAEANDAATGMINLRARQYEPVMNLFAQKDILKGQIMTPLSLNRYGYCWNNPIMHIDPSGQAAKSFFEAIGDSFVGLGDAIKVIATGFVDGYKTRAEKMMADPSPINIINWLTSGGVDHVEERIEINQQNYQRAIEESTIENWANYLSGNITAETKQALEAALDPSNPTAQWLAYFGLAGQCVGVSKLVSFDIHSITNFKNNLTGKSITPKDVVTTKDVIKIGNERRAVSGVVSKGTFDNAFENNTATKPVVKVDPEEINVSVDIKEAASSNQTFDSFSAFKKTYGAAGDEMDWHHIVEQNQLGKSGFTPQQINNVNNIVAIDKSTHSKISGYYSSKRPYTNGLRVRNWLAGKDFEYQHQFGINVLKKALEKKK